MKPPIIGGGRRELNVTCPACNYNCMLPPSAIMRNQFFCSGCGKQLDLKMLLRQMAGDSPGPGVGLGARNDRESRYKSARKAANRR